MNDSAIMCDEVTESCNKEAKTTPTNFYEKKESEKSKISIFYLHFY